MKKTRIRASLVLWLLFIGLLSVVARAAYLQLRPPQKLVEFAQSKKSWVKKRANEEFIQSRGSILDRQARELALSIISKSYFANPRLINRPKTVAYKLARYLNIDQKTLEEKLSSDRHFVWLKREVGEKAARKINRLDIPGIHASKESQRVYPHGEMAKSILGLSGRDGQGLEGVERSYDRWLRAGDQADEQGIRDALGRFLLFRDFEKQWFEANDVHLTIDLRFQKIMEEELRDVLLKKEALSAQGVMMDPKTGAILAMASLDHPDREVRFFRNRVLSDMYEPGSTFKIVTALSALRHLHFTPESQVFAEEGDFQIGSNRIQEYNSKEYGWLSLREMLSKSSNIAAAKLSLKLKAERLHESIRSLGFGSETGIDLPGEADGILRAWEKWRPIDLANISFGQGVAITPLQLTRAYAAIANGGFLVRPHVVERISSPSTKKINFQEEKVSKTEAMDPDLARQMTEMLVSVTQKGATGHLAQIPGFQVGGKTGTSQKLVEKELADGSTRKTYSFNKSIVSFVGFVPARDPAFVLYVMFDEPERPASGGVTAAPVFRKIAEKTLGLMGIEPSRPKLEDNAHFVPSKKDKLFVGQSFEEVLSEIESWDQDKREHVRLYGFGTAVKEEVSENEVRVYFE